MNATNTFLGLIEGYYRKSPITIDQYLRMVADILASGFKGLTGSNNCASISGAVTDAWVDSHYAGLTKWNTKVGKEDHMILRNNDTKQFIDFAYRQFDKSAPVPIVISIDEWERYYDVPPKRWGSNYRCWLHDDDAIKLHRHLKSKLAELVESKPKGKDWDEVSLKQDDDGWYVCTHRSRSKSYPDVDSIPKTVVANIASTG